MRIACVYITYLYVIFSLITLFGSCFLSQDDAKDLLQGSSGFQSIYPWLAIGAFFALNDIANAMTKKANDGKP